MKVKCYECQIEAIYLCNCSSQEQYFCSAHSLTHRQIHPNSPLKKISACYFSINLASQTALTEKILSIRKQAENLKYDFFQSIKNTWNSIQEQATLVITEINEFIKICDENLQELKTKKIIKIKEFYSPLEWALISENINCLLNQFSYPKLHMFPDSLPIFIPSNFSNLLSNYSSVSAVYKDTATLYIHPYHKEISNPLLSHSSRALQISSDELLITGGGHPLSTSCRILEVHTCSLKTLQDLQSGRKFHAMSYINGFPAVLGGTEEIFSNNLKTESQLRSVEFFHEKVWKKGPDMNIARCGASAVYIPPCTWIMGGWDKGCTNVIEKFENNRWEIVQITLPIPCRSAATVGVGKKIIVFGGKISGGKNIDNMWILDTVGLKLRAMDKISYPADFSEQLVRCDEKGFSIIGNGGKLIKYLI